MNNYGTTKAAPMQSGHLLFLLAGNATFTLVSGATGERYTYNVRRAEESQRYFVSFLTGPDNTSDYKYLGQIRYPEARFSLTEASKLTEDSLPVKAFAWMFQRLQSSRPLTGAEFWHTGRCGRCGRLLTVPESIANGFGPECVQLVGRAA